MDTAKNPAAIITVEWTEGTHEVCDAWEGRRCTPQEFAQLVAIQKGDIGDRGHYNKTSVKVDLAAGGSLTFRVDIRAEFTTLRDEVHSWAQWRSARNTLLEQSEAAMYRQVVADLEAAEAPTTNAHADFCAQFLGL